jgi:multiple sugar transport system permease protein
MKQGNRRGLSETHIGYLLVIPALLVILVIAIWPVIQSFWLSLHDVRLNDPAKNEIHSDYALNLEQYADSIPYIGPNLDKEIQKVDGKTKARLEQVKQNIQGLQAELNKDPQFAKKYDKVDEMLLNFETIPEDLKFVELQPAQAKAANQKLDSVYRELAALNKEKKLKKPDDTLGLVKGLRDSMVEPNFVGLKYYQYYLNDNRMWTSLGNTVVFTVISVSLELVLGLWIAMLINKHFIGRGLVRASVLIPWAIPTVISALMWKFLFDGQNGIMAKLFVEIGLIPDMGTLLTTKFWSMFAVIFSDVWKTTPFMALLILAGLQTIPQNLYEAARVDGASKVQQFFTITLPLLKSTILVALLFRTLDAFRVFDLIYVLTGGGPANSTETISIYAYKVMFAQTNFGAGSALAVIVFFCVAIISMVFVKFLGKDLVSDGRGR